MRKSFTKKTKYGSKSGPKLHSKQHQRIEMADMDNSSLKEGIQDLKILISNINQQANI